MTSAAIAHQPAQQRFVLQLAGDEASVHYQLNGQQINFDHTYVPPAFRGQGLAEQLVRHALDWAQAQQYQVNASCSYVQRFLS